MAEDIHAEHRQRMLQKYMKHGLDVFDDHEVFELLLFYAIPRKNTNEIGHQIMQQAGGVFCDALNAPPDKLRQIDGIGSYSAALVRLVHDIAIRYQKSQAEQSMCSVKLNNRPAIAEYFKPQFLGETEEVLLAAFLDGTGRVLKCIECGRGAHNSVSINSYKIAQTALHCGAHGVALAHNHPNGRIDPSQTDIDSTAVLESHLHGLGIELVEHCIVAGSRTSSIGMILDQYKHRR